MNGKHMVEISRNSQSVDCQLEAMGERLAAYGNSFARSKIREEDMEMETKQEILDAFLPALTLTRAGSDVEALEYDEIGERVAVIFKSGYVKEVNVACDSGIAMLRDVLTVIN